MRIIAPTQTRLRVCEVCGAQLNVLDHETRLADHYGGKMHLGMINIREKYDTMKVGIIWILIYFFRKELKRDVLTCAGHMKKKDMNEENERNVDMMIVHIVANVVELEADLLERLVAHVARVHPLYVPQNLVVIMTQRIGNYLNNKPKEILK